MKFIYQSKLIEYIVLCFVLILPHNTFAEEKSFGTFFNFFSVNSLWNSQPIHPTFADYTIPTSQYYPTVQQGKYSTGLFKASKEDTEITIYSYPDRKGVWDPDTETHRASIKIKHWPKNVLPAEGGDGHADIVDEESGVIHSFWQLKQIGDKWFTTQYAWTMLNGRGWGDPAHYFQGARAAAVPATAGIIRQHEIDDGKDIYEHALAMSLAHNGLSRDPTYVFPATSADTSASTTNSGKIPEGALLMLPPEFDISQIKTPKLIKVVNTLKKYGGYVVDRNHGTPFVIYVENGAKEYTLKNPLGLWDSQAAKELHIIRENLRQVVNAEGWLNGRGEWFVPEKNLNLLSMRGPWRLVSGSELGEFETLEQAVVFGKTTSNVIQENNSGRSMQAILWAKPQVGESYKLTSFAEGSAKLSLKIVDKQLKKIVFQSKTLSNGETQEFKWPANDFSTILTIHSGVGERSKVHGELIKSN